MSHLPTTGKWLKLCLAGLLSGLIHLPAIASTPPKIANSQFVDPFIGTGGDGHSFPGAVVSFGMMLLSPDTEAVFRGVDPQP